MGAVERPGGEGADGAPEEVADHVGAVDPAAGIGAQRVDHRLVGDLHALGAHVEHDDPDDEGGQRRAAGPQQREGAGQQDAGDDGGGGVPGRVGQLAGEVGRHDPARADQAEEPDDQRWSSGTGSPESRKASVVHSTLKAAKAQAPCQARRRSTGSVDQQAQRRPDELGGSCGAGVRPRRAAPATARRRSTTMSAAESQ